LAKLKRDPRANAFRAKHNGELFQVEVDALVAYVPDDFKELVLDSVDAFFDEDIHAEVKEEYSEEDITELVKESTSLFLRDFTIDDNE
jgi:hypothetical protein